MIQLFFCFSTKKQSFLFGPFGAACGEVASPMVSFLSTMGY